MPDGHDAPPLDDRAQPQALPAAAETGDQAQTEPEGYPFPVDEWK
jgi:hypothetical protein